MGSLTGRIEGKRIHLNLNQLLPYKVTSRTRPQYSFNAPPARLLPHPLPFSRFTYILTGFFERTPTTLLKLTHAKRLFKGLKLFTLKPIR